MFAVLVNSLGADFEPAGDLDVCVAFADQAQHFTFSIGEFRVDRCGSRVCAVLYRSIDYELGDAGRKDPLPAHDRSDRVDNLNAARFLQQVTARTCL
jgi:hypothetical protein